ARRQEVATEGLVLGVGHVAKADLLPAGPGVAGVHVGQELGVAPPLDRGPSLRREPGEELGELAADHRAGVGAGQVGPVGGAHAGVGRERRRVGRQPRGEGRGAPGEEAEELAGRPLGPEVAGAAMAELVGRDLEHLHARRARDRRRAIARAAGVKVLEIPPDEFGHGRPRNLGAERTSGEFLCFLTRGATPLPAWLAAHPAAFAPDARVGAAYGPHLPRPDTSPMISRELTEFFTGFAPEGRPAVQRGGDAEFLSNVNACYARACWEEIRFRDVAYAEDQAFGRDLLAAG